MLDVSAEVRRWIREARRGRRREREKEREGERWREMGRDGERWREMGRDGERWMYTYIICILSYIYIGRGREGKGKDEVVVEE